MPRQGRLPILLALPRNMRCSPFPRGVWPKLRHKETNVDVDIHPEHARPGTPARPAPTTIPHPAKLGAGEGQLKYIELLGLIELKLAAGRARDESDVVELILANLGQVDALRVHLATVHEQYARQFDHLVARAHDQAAQ